MEGREAMEGWEEMQGSGVRPNASGRQVMKQSEIQNGREVGTERDGGVDGWSDGLREGWMD
jgi:hypothetical protein